MVRITAKKDGFCRCGQSHPSSPTDYPDDRFTQLELRRLHDEPMLVVQQIPDPPAQQPEVAVQPQTIEPEIKARGKGR